MNQGAGPSIVDSEVEEALPESHTRTTSEKALTQRDEAGEDHDKVGREKMWLQMMEVKKIMEKRTGRESEDDLSAGSAPQDLSGNLAGVNQGLDVAGGSL